MSAHGYGDVVVTVPKWFGLETWIDEGDAAGEPWSGTEWHFYLGGGRPDMRPGDRVYVVFNGAVRGYAPLVRIERDGNRFALVRHGDAVACTIPAPVLGFRGWRYRWWSREVEVPFPEWRNPNARPPLADTAAAPPPAVGKPFSETTRRWLDSARWGGI